MSSKAEKWGLKIILYDDLSIDFVSFNIPKV
jgi:hypothetical protein